MTNLEVAQRAKLVTVDDIACCAGLETNDFEPLGRYKGKLSMAAVSRLSRSEQRGKLVLVTAINPTPSGEGKTTVSIGLSQGLNRLGKMALPALREPAVGPVFGIKGGACGGGYSQVLPMEDINLFFNGDFPAITAAHGLLSAMLDTSLHEGNPLEIDVQNVWWPRAVDMIDRALREIVVGLGHGNGPLRMDAFVITPASEVMAALCMADSLQDLKDRLGRIVVGLGPSGRPVSAGELNAVGAMAALLRDAIRPNLAQTMENGPALIHGGPFGNIAHGCSSLLATKCGLAISDYLVTEGGFGSDLGGEKFLNIVCPQLGAHPDVIVLVATVRALKYHGGGELQKGFANLAQHVRHLTSYGPPLIVAVNRFEEDAPKDLQAVYEYAEALGVDVAVCDPFHGGGSGCEQLAEQVACLAENASPFRNVYQPTDPVKVKLEKLVQGVYGGKSVSFSKPAEKRLMWIEDHGFSELPLCVAKTQKSLSDDPHLIGAPRDFDLHVREIRVSAGAGFLVPVCGDILLMPGMGKTPAAAHIDVDDEGVISGLY